MAENIIVCGMNGAGKTTFGKALADKIGYSFVDIEDLFFPDKSSDYKYEVSRSEEEVSQLLFDILTSGENIVLASVTGKYIVNPERFFSYCIIMCVDKEARLLRVKNRSLEMFGDRIKPGGDLYNKEQQYYRLVETRKETIAEEWADSLQIPIIRLNGENKIEDNMSIVMNTMQNHRYSESN